MDEKNKAEWLDTRPGEHCLIRVAANETNGDYSVVEIVSDPGDGTPLHLHENEDEHFFILEGVARIRYGEKTFDALPGEVLTLRRGIPHAWGNRSNTRLRLAVVVTPGGVEEALRLIPTTPSVDLPALAGRFHVKTLGPTPF
jgi:mannose-6-phosphate isomerase-like protein (cupin superfamily)